MTTQITFRPAGSGAVCASILAELPEWFGLPQSNASYARLADDGPAWIAEVDGEAAGLMVLKPHFDTAVEIELMAVRPGRHRSGLGRALVDQANAVAADRGALYLTVKTRGPSKPYEPYERTRAFYQAMGFVALEEFAELWDAENPALFMVRPVRPNS